MWREPNRGRLTTGDCWVTIVCPLSHRGALPYPCGPLRSPGSCDVRSRARRRCGAAGPARILASESRDRARVVQLELNDEIEPVMAEYLVDGIEAANREQATLILITVDTPGGLDTSMREIIQHIIESKTPVAVYVTPSGARAASAGFFV